MAGKSRFGRVLPVILRYVAARTLYRYAMRSIGGEIAPVLNARRLPNISNNLSSMFIFRSNDNQHGTAKKPFQDDKFATSAFQGHNTPEQIIGRTRIIM